MDRKLLATFAVALFLLSALMPASAHFTLGELDGTITRGVRNDGPYTGKDPGPYKHVKGPLGYVFPGAGLWSESLYGGPWRWGYGYFPGSDQIHGYDPLGLRLHTGGNHYSPWEAILTSVDMDWDGKYEYESKGDLIFALNFSNPGESTREDVTYTSWLIYIPAATDAYGRYTGEGFIPPVDWSKGDTSNIVTTLTNDYISITVGKADDKDPFAPGWYWIYIGATISFKANADNWYYVRVNGLTAPTVAGKYFFKMFLNETWPTRANAYGSQTEMPGGLLGGNTFYTPPYANVVRWSKNPMPAENWPCLIVKGEVDPAYIYGVVRFGGHNPALYGKPVNLAGKVVAEGEAIDPYKWPSIVKTGRKVKAVAYFNETAHGRYALEGVAPGIYTIKASCAGYPEGAEWQITVGPGQSYSHDFYLTPGAVIWGKIYSKCGLGAIAWPTVGTASKNWYPLDNPTSAALGPPITVEIEDLKGNVVTRSPVNLTHRPFTSYAVGDVRWDWRTGYVTTAFTPKAVAFPWSYYTVTTDGINWGTEYPSPYNENWFLTKNAVPNGVGPQQYWWLPGGSTDPFQFQFGLEGWFGAPTEFSGYVPQAYATWVNGLLPGQYKVKAYVNGYVQTEDYIVTVPAAEFPGNIMIEMDLRKGSWINVTVHFHHFENSLVTNPIEVPEPGLYMIAEAYDMDGKLRAFNFTFVKKTNSSYWIMLNGFGMAGPDNNRWTGPTKSLSGGYLDDTTWKWPDYTAADWAAPKDKTPSGSAGVGYKYFLWRYRGLKDYGLMPGTYKIKVYVRGYVQQEEYAATVSLCASPTALSMHLVKGGSINVTLTSKDWQHPWVEKVWKFGGKAKSGVRIRFKKPDGTYTEWFRAFYDSEGKGWKDNLDCQPNGKTTIPYYPWPYAQKLIYNGSNYAEFRGPDQILYGAFWNGKDWGFVWRTAYYPTALTTGTYAPEAFTIGYVQKMFPTVWVGKGTSSISDIEIDLDVGAEINMTVFFKKESIFSPTPFPMSARARVYDQAGKLVAADDWLCIPEGTDKISWLLAGFGGGIQNGVWAPATYAFSYAEVSRKLFPSYGIPAGTYTIELDFVPLDLDAPTTWVTGLLTGEYGNKDRPYYYPWNHLGPYEQRTVVTVTVSESGEVSPIFEVDLRGAVKGYAMAYNWKGELRTVGWATVYAGAAPDDGTLTAYTFGGFFDMYLPAGTHTLKMASWGHATGSFPVSVTEGADLMGIWFEMEQTGVPIPEFPIVGLVTAASLAASIYALGRVRRKREE